MRLLILGLLAVALPAFGQQQTSANTPTPQKPAPAPENNEERVVLSGIATTAHIADPNERVVFNGRVMKMADYVAAVSSSSEAVQRLRNLEKQNREKDQPTPPSKPSN
jgi:hypothetical protein